MPDQAEVQILVDPVANAYAKVWQQIVDAQAAMVEDPLNMLARRRLREIQQAIAHNMRELDGVAKDWIENQMPRAYMLGSVTGSTEAGGMGGVVFSQIAEEAVERLATGLYTDLLKATTHVNDSTKSLIRAVGRDVALRKAIQGRTAVQAGREMARILSSKGISAITYANGAKHGLAEYAEMSMRTVTGHTYNMGTLEGAAHEGTQFWEVFDGTDCGWEEHNSPNVANGRIVSMQEAQTFPLAHPNCRRAFGPRPDVTKKPKGQPEQRDDLGQPKEPTASPPTQTTLMSDAEAKRRLSQDGRYVQTGQEMHRADMPDTLHAPTTNVTAAAQKAWMVGPGGDKGDYPWNDFIRQSMARQRGLPEPPPMADLATRGRIPDMDKVDNWAKSFIKGIEKETEPHDMLWRGGHVGDVGPGDTFDMVPASWSAHPGVASTYGHDIVVVRNAYGVTLNEGKFNLDDLEVVAGGRMKVVSVREFDVEHVYPSYYPDRPPMVEKKHYRLFEVEQLERLV